MLRSEKKYPLVGLDLSGNLKKAWENGWLDEFSDDHFLIKAIEKRLEHKPILFIGQSCLSTLYPVKPESFQENFCINFSAKIGQLISLFGEDNIQRFFTDQLSAGKANYVEDQFFRALSEVSVLCFLGMNAKSGEYEPRINGEKNPEARLYYNNGIVVDVEVKTPGFQDFFFIFYIVIPTVLLDESGRIEFTNYCSQHGINGKMPRVMKIKEFLNNAADKFMPVDHIHHMNLLYINWSWSEFEESGYQEAFSLMANSVNGMLTHKEIGIQLGVHEEVYDKITAVIVYTESLHGLMFGEFRCVWIRGQDGQPQFGIIGLHDSEELQTITGMNPYAEQMTPIITGIFRNTAFVPELIDLIHKHMLKSELNIPNCLRCE